MPDLSAGTIVKGLDTPPTIDANQSGSYTATNTGYDVAVTGGAYADCAVVFTAPTTGRVLLHIAATARNATAGAPARVAPEVRTGGTIGTGTIVFAAAHINSVQQADTNLHRAGAAVLVTGLTPGAVYNARLLHMVSSGTGTFAERTIIAAPST
jgi:hypothetical protein